MKKHALKRLPVIAHDLFEAGEWYEDQQPGIGLAADFDDEASAAIESLRSEALMNHIRFRDVRRAAMPRFRSYGVYYVIRQQTVIVIAVFHDARDPQLLRERRRDVEALL